jgi:hypothetical protein
MYSIYLFNYFFLLCKTHFISKFYVTEKKLDLRKTIILHRTYIIHVYISSILVHNWIDYSSLRVSGVAKGELNGL